MNQGTTTANHQKDEVMPTPLDVIETDARNGIQVSQCELGCALLSGIVGNLPDGTYRLVPRNADEALSWLTRGTDFAVHGEPTEETYSFIVDALNSLGSYFEVHADDIVQAKMFYKQSADLFVQFGGEFEGTIAGRNFLRLSHHGTSR